MTLFAIALLCVTGVLSLGSVLYLVTVADARHSANTFAEGVVCASALFLLAASGVLAGALVRGDYSIAYVASYTDNALPLFYKITAFWAGQAGSLLFWALTVALSGSFFVLGNPYRRLSAETKRWFHVFFLTVTGFLGVLLTVYSNPFMLGASIPPDGHGLNPLLQNPGMIFHPPLLFLGYGGFTVPACLALAMTVSGKSGSSEEHWIKASRPFILTAWGFLTAGIVLGAWWAYMELGWGGYWAWDPVENASLIPWLVATAALHTCAIETKRGNLAATNVFLMSLTTLSAFFATYLVRSGIVQSVHAFGDGGVGTPLLIFVFLGLLLAAFVAWEAHISGQTELAGPESREGLMVITGWLLLILACIILVATLWPVFTSWFGTSHGLKADFYNRVCMPVFTGLIALLALCPWLNWTGGVRNGRCLALVIVGILAVMGGMWAFDFRLPTAMLGAGAAAGVLLGCVFLRTVSRDSLQVCLAHAGVALIALAIAFSGPFKTEADLTLKSGETGKAGPYSVLLKEIQFGDGADFVFARGIVEIAQEGRQICTLTPERRIHDKWRDMQFAEADTSFSLRTEIYASLIAVDGQGNAQLRISLHPLVNWLWIGGALLSLIPFAMLRHRQAGTRRAC